MIRKSFFNLALAGFAAAAVFVSCGGDSGTTPNPQASPSAQPTPTPTPTAQPTATPSPAAATNCPPPRGEEDHSGPVVRYAIAPRSQFTNDQPADMRIRALPGWDEVWCLDKDATEHRIDFNSNQRNAAGFECCWENNPTWEILQDAGMVSSANTVANTNDFNYRIRIRPEGRTGTIRVQATLDGNRSYPFQSNTGYRQEAFRIVVMSRNEMDRDCKCIYEGNGIYRGEGCIKGQ